MKVILLENIKRVGSIGEVIDVKRGFARNFLISNKKALYASRENIAQVEKIKSEFEDVRRTYLPMHSIIRIDEVDKQGISKISKMQNGNVAQFPMPMYTPSDKS